MVCDNMCHVTTEKLRGPPVVLLCGCCCKMCPGLYGFVLVVVSGFKSIFGAFNACLEGGGQA
jgi:hypothetical protein